ncbi:TlpA family protein disulfide reductase [Wenzhouxiangella marina]|uniref:Thioredoxin n=1 Tax=Wenzhouxiangella marina TaxID=1579979 RepID=A0A0K0XT61_9GAMM|nr:TlpA disulfide reductase family protein [Wenzhouxiangella marina]AKS40806.1 thioredoxin [Wenzhouxiangella marina]MBB6087680.1 thiol-disulfide isomerase/thioredoxin [Wenzhouxiangella marina]
MSRLILVLSLLAGHALADSDSSIAESASPEAPTIAFSLPDLDGRDHALDDYRGDWVVVNYWATWCAPCRKEIPDLSNLHDSRADITVLGLAFEDTEVEVFREFLVEYPATYPILLVDVYDPPSAFGAPRALPTTYLIDPDGRLAQTWIGPVTGEQISGWIDSNG